MVNTILITNLKVQKMKEYKIQIPINAPKEAVWKALTAFKNYPDWNSVLRLENNDSLKVGNKFNVTIKKAGDKQSNFMAIVTSKEANKSFAARQKIMGKWFFQATHHFMIEEIDKHHINFIQLWKLKGIVAALFKKQIFKELEEFKVMNKELKAYAEKQTN